MTSDINWSEGEKLQYQRHFILKDFGVQGQAKLKNASVLVVGAGGLGCPVLQYLVAAGVGRIGIADGDVVSASNLHRQILFNWNDLNQAKVRVAQQKLAALNPHIIIETHEFFINESNALEIFKNYDLIVDGSDNFKTRYLVNDACEILNKPLVFGAIYQFDGQVSVFHFNGGPSYRDLFPNPPEKDAVPNCAESGVLGVLPGIIGSLQAAEVIKIITGIGEVLSAKLLTFDLRTMGSRILKFSADEERTKVKTLIPINDYCEVIQEIPEIEAFELEEWIEKGEVQLIDIRELWERELANLDSIWLNPDALSVELPPEIDLQKRTVLFCKVGQRTQKWFFEYKKLGFKNLSTLKGGIIRFAQETGADIEKY